MPYVSEDAGLSIIQFLCRYAEEARKRGDIETAKKMYELKNYSFHFLQPQYCVEWHTEGSCSICDRERKALDSVSSVGDVRKGKKACVYKFERVILPKC